MADTVNDTSAKTNTDKLGIQNIAKDGYEAVSKIEGRRSEIMDQVKNVAAAGDDKVITMPGATATWNDTTKKYEGDFVEIDISTGAGALVLDDYLQELSTVEQSAAQLVAQENKAQKQIHSQTGQG